MKKKKKLRKRTGERKKDRGRFWKVESRKNKKGGDGIYGYSVWWRKIKRKKKRKKNRNVWMIE